MASFSWKDPKTGKTYYGAEGQARWVASMSPPAPAKGVDRPGLLPPPPVGTYDPAIDYNAGASQRGFGQTQDDAATAYEQGQQDYGLQSGDLKTTRDRQHADYGTQTADLTHQFSILGHQQADHAAQAGITSAGLLGKSAAIRGANQQHDQSALDLQDQRGAEDYTRAQQGLDLTNARTYGGYGGHTIINPLTGQPEVGSLVTSLTRSGAENNAFQSGSAQQRAFGAAGSGYVPPTGSAPSSGLLAYMKKLGMR